MAKDTVQKSDNAYWAACMERVASERDQSSFMALYDHFSPRVNAYLQGRGVDAATAEDLTQEALLTLWRKAGLYRSQRAAVSTWLFRVARNLWIDRLRSQRGMAYQVEEEYVDSAVEVDVTKEDGYWYGDAADAGRIREAMEGLPRHQAQVVYKSYFEGKSHSEIAGETGMALGSVKSSLRLALKAFRELFGEQ